MKKKGNLMSFFIPNQNIYLWIIGILAFIIYGYNKGIAIVTGIILVYLIYYKIISTNISEEKWKQTVENLSLDIDAATQKILLEIPFPFIIIKKDGEIIWYNSIFRQDSKVSSNLLSTKIMDIIEDIDMKKINDTIEEKKPLQLSLGEKKYKVFSNKVESIKNEQLYMLYWLDITDAEIIRQNYISQKSLTAYIQIDNYDEVIQDSSESYRPLISAVIDRKLNSWAKEIDAFLKKYESDEYLLIFEHKHLSSIEEKKFNILDNIRETQSGNKIPITLSIGVGYSENSDSFNDNQKLSRSALDIALARGGDQAVVRKDEKISYYGGKSQAIEKRTKVKARVKAHGIKDIIEHSDKIYIVGHQNPDIDCLGAALGIYRCSQHLEKDAYILLNKSNPSIDILYNTLADEGYEDIFVTSEFVDKSITKDSLIIVVDAHRRSFLEDSNILDKGAKVIIIDHHRRGSDFIDEAVLVYLEPYASSTCELVAEIVEYMDENIKLEEIEASALLAGIYVDTKDFSFRTGVRTFEAASYLKRKGADINRCRQFLKDDKDVFVAKIEAARSAEITDGIAIAMINYKSDKIKLIVAQTADELLNLQGVEASFVIAQDDEGAFISARSLGDISVQLILEKIGGGGHLSIAGAQLAETSNEEAKILLKNEIQEYLRESEDK